MSTRAGLVVLTPGHYLACIVAAFAGGFLLALIVFWGAIFGG